MSKREVISISFNGIKKWFYIKEFGEEKLIDIISANFNVEHIDSSHFFFQYVTEDGLKIEMRSENIDYFARSLPWAITNSVLKWEVPWRGITLNDLIVSVEYGIIPDFEGFEFDYYDLACGWTELPQYADLIEYLDQFLNYAADLAVLKEFVLFWKNIITKYWNKWGDRGAKNIGNILAFIFSRPEWDYEQLAHLLGCENHEAILLLENLGFKKNGNLHKIDNSLIARSFEDLIMKNSTKKTDILIKILTKGQIYMDLKGTDEEGNFLEETISDLIEGDALNDPSNIEN
ncbi:hypothetical protein [Desulfosporosinus shakirovi]|uniref:hypothetical protein n=1 Tax=Desulfosporosinus shakirovi TaxID=2885154 RepID=UPI001E605536|nr:hypothetical protein [Desulfosporosinus sp. SRJS8]MCB8817388.1 hypothetical protein [Desulfosporosinus sp. SRJS8]